MNRFFSNIYISYILLAVTASVYTIDVISGGVLNKILCLEPAAITGKLEFWRLFSYPLAHSNIEDVIFYFLTFYLVAPKLELIFNRALFSLLLILLICMQGALLSLVYWGSWLKFTGMEGISVFVITIFTFLNINKKNTLWYLQPLKSYFIISLIWLAWLFGSLVRFAFQPGTDFITYKLSGLGFGLLTGLLLFLQFKITKSKRKSEPKPDIPKPEELSMALISKTSQQRRYTQNKFSDILGDDLDDFSEEQLNKILDKILESGKESLSYYEMKYLKEYSKRME